MLGEINSCNDDISFTAGQGEDSCKCPQCILHRNSEYGNCIVCVCVCVCVCVVFFCTMNFLQVFIIIHYLLAAE